LQFDCVPAGYDHVIDRIQTAFVPRIEAVGEDWRFALERHGSVYAPLSVAMARTLAEELHATVLAPAGIAGWVVAYFTSREWRMLGLVVIGTADPDRDALPRLRDPLTMLAGLAAATLETSLQLARGLGVIVPELGSDSPDLTPRQHQIADLVAQGYSNVNIAARLGLSANTIGVHIRNIYRKLKVHSRVELSDALQRLRA
jgi:DNA-binding CsgD family transcriptional regulator